jgi:hypothetical protein
MEDAGAAVGMKVIPTGGVAGSPMFFDNEGKDVPWVNLAGTRRDITLAGDETNRENAPRAYVCKWSDFCPVTSIRQADDEQNRKPRLLFIYTTVSSLGCVTNTTDFRGIGFNSDRHIAPRGRFYYQGVSWHGDADYADTPAEIRWKNCGFSPLMFIQYLSFTPGIQVVNTGDSLSGGNPQPANALWRACMGLSMPDRPIEYATFSWPSARAAVWDVNMQNNADAVMPSIYIPQAHSYNDPLFASSQQKFLVTKSAMAAYLRSKYGTRMALYLPGLAPNADGIPVFQSGFEDIVARCRSLDAAGSVPFIDATQAISLSENTPWLYATGMSSDGIHPNSDGCEAVVPLASAALLRLIAWDEPAIESRPWTKTAAFGVSHQF